MSAASVTPRSYLFYRRANRGSKTLLSGPGVGIERREGGRWVHAWSTSRKKSLIGITPHTYGGCELIFVRPDVPPGQYRAVWTILYFYKDRSRRDRITSGFTVLPAPAAP